MSGAAFIRIWRGRVPRERADEYQAYWTATGIAPLLAKGALKVESLRDDGEAETVFMTISHWPSEESMGENPRAAHHLPRDPEFLVELPKQVEMLRLLRTDAEEAPRA